MLFERAIVGFGTLAKSADNVALLHIIDARATEGNFGPVSQGGK